MVQKGHSLEVDFNALADSTTTITIERLTADSADFKGGIKAAYGATIEFVRYEPGEPYKDANGEMTFPQIEILQEISRWAPVQPLLAKADASDFKAYLLQSYAFISSEIEKFVQNGSSWAVKRVVKVDLKIDRYSPGRGGSYIPTPNGSSTRSAV
jgi:hypothetical protein